MNKVIACDGHGAMQSNELLAVPLVVLAQVLPLTTELLDLGRLQAPPLATLDHQCRHCGATWRVPGTVDRNTLRELEAVLEMLREFAVESGAMDWSVAGLVAKAHTAIAARPAPGEDGGVS